MAPSLGSRSALPKTLLLCLVCLLSNLATGPSLEAGTAELQSGPMVGYSTMREVALWAQTTGPAEISIRYWALEEPRTSFFTDAVAATKKTAFAVRLLADQVEAGKVYGYQLLIDGEAVERPYPLRFQTPKLWQWREDPPAFTAAVGSCNYVNEPAVDRPGDPYGGDHRIFTTIHARRPDLMLWLGDNTYLREVDWNSRTGILWRHTHTRSLPELQPLLASTHNYATWDDHDAGPDNTNRAQWNLDVAREGFEIFWANPSTGVPAVDGHVPGVRGVTTYFQWADVDFFLLDNRTWRTPNERRGEERTLLGQRQIGWLIDALAKSRAPFKMVAMGGQFLNTARAHETYSNLAPEERERILRLLRQERITGVIFLSGDRHHSEASKLAEVGHPPIYDLTFSPLTAGARGRASEEVNTLRIEGTLEAQRNFGWLEYTGPRGARRLAAHCYGTDGDLLWEIEIPEGELRTPTPRPSRR